MDVSRPEPDGEPAVEPRRPASDSLPILNYAGLEPEQRSGPRPTVILFGVILCAIGILVGLLAMCMGVWVLGQAAFDGPGVLRDAIVLMLIGLVMGGSSYKWLREGVRRLRAIRSEASSFEDDRSGEGQRGDHGR